MSDLLLEPQDNLIQQSLHARSPRTPTNGDGFGLGWYDNRPLPGLFRSIHPAWTDPNLHDLCNHIQSPLFLAHVRASSLATVLETNCHPFWYKTWLFVHNGQIADFGELHQALLARVGPAYFRNMLGSTESEVMFHLALSFGLEQDVPTSIREMVRTVEAVGKAHSLAESIWMTLGISDGKNLLGFRHGSDGQGPTLYISPDISELQKLNPEVADKLGDFAACLVSEPIGKFQDQWQEIPEQSQVLVSGHSVTVEEFRP